MRQHCQAFFAFSDWLFRVVLVNSPCFLSLRASACARMIAHSDCGNLPHAAIDRIVERGIALIAFNASMPQTNASSLNFRILLFVFLAHFAIGGTATAQ